MEREWTMSTRRWAPATRTTTARMVRCGVVTFLLAGALPTAAASAASPGGAIEGRVWRLARLRGLDQQALAAVADGATIRFEQGRLQGFAGCNRLAGSYTIDGERLTIGPLAGTMMACAEPVMVVETAFKRALSGTLRFRADQESLTLTPDAETEPALVFVAAPPPQLEGIVWEVTGYNNGRQAVVSPLTGTALTLGFENGTVAGRAGCNDFRASYSRTDDRLTIKPPAATRKQCADDVMEQERQFLAALHSSTTWTVDNGMLDMHRADGERTLTASPAAPAAEPSP